MITITNKIFVGFFVLLLVSAAAGYAYWQEAYFFGLPFVLLLAVLSLQFPEYLFYSLLLSIPWSIEYNFGSSLGTDLPDEPLMLLAAFSALIGIIYQNRRSRSGKLHPLILILVLQFLWTIITVITSTDPIVSIKYLAAKSWYLLAFVGLPLILFKDEKVLKRSAVLLVLSMFIVTMLALVRQGFYGWSFEKINDSLKPFFRNHVNYSALLVFMVPVQIAMIQLSSRRKRTLLFPVLLITIAAVYFSYARGAWLAMVVGIFAYWLLKKRVLVFSFLFLLSMIVASVFWIKSEDRFVKFSNDYKTTIFHSNFREHIVATYQLKDLSNAERIYRWVAGVRMIKDSWKTGFGPSTFYHQYKTYTLPAFKTYVSQNKEQSTVHNYFLLILVEQGVAGCLLFVSLLTALFWYAQKIYLRTKDRFWKVVIAAAASILVMECTVNFLSDMIETDKAGSIFYLCVAVIIIADNKTRSSDPSANVKRIS